MAKPVHNGRIIRDTITGRIMQLNQWVTQNLQPSATPTFASLELSGDLSVRGDLYVYGMTSTFETEYTQFKDNILLLNADETSSGVTLVQSGLEIDRGQLENYRIVYDEASRTLKVGFLSDLNSIAGLKSNPVANGILQWDSDAGVMYASSNVTAATTFFSTLNADAGVNFDGGTVYGSAGTVYVSAGALSLGATPLRFGAADLVASGGNIRVRSGDLCTPRVSLTTTTGSVVGGVSASGANVVLTSLADSVLVSATNFVIPQSTFLKFGESGYASSDNFGNINFQSYFGDIAVNAANLALRNSTSLTFGDGSQIRPDPDYGLTVKSDFVTVSTSNLLLGKECLITETDSGTLSIVNPISMYGMYLVSGNLDLVSLTSSSLSFSTPQDTSNTKYTFSRTSEIDGDLQLTIPASNARFTINGGTQGLLYASTPSGVVVPVLSANELHVTSALDVGDTRVTSVADPVSPTDAANKRYVDVMKQGLYPKDSVDVATTVSTGNITCGSLVDGAMVTTGSRILVKDGATTGIFTFDTAGSLVRTPDLQSGMHAGGTFVFVKDGTVNANLGFVCTNPPESDIVDSTPLTFTEFTGLGQVIPGNGISKDFNTISVKIDNSSLEFNSSSIRVSQDVCGVGLVGGSGVKISTSSDQTHVTALGSVSTGQWQASTITVPYGGTGATQFTIGKLVVGNGTGGVLSSAVLMETSGSVLVSGALIFGENSVCAGNTGLTVSPKLECDAVSTGSMECVFVSAGNVNAIALCATGITSNSVQIEEYSVKTSSGNLCVNDIVTLSAEKVEVTPPVSIGNLFCNKLEMNSHALRYTVTSGETGWWYLGHVTSGQYSINGSNLYVTNTSEGTIFDSKWSVFQTAGHLLLFYYNDTLGALNLDARFSSDEIGMHYEGSGAVPNGTVSGYSAESAVAFDYPKVTVGGLSVNSNLHLSPTRDIVFERAFSDIVAGDNVSFTCGSQTGVTMGSVRLPPSASSVDGYYTGYCISNGGDSAIVTGYNGSQRIAFANVLVAEGDVVSLFKYVSNMVTFSEAENSFLLRNEVGMSNVCVGDASANSLKLNDILTNHVEAVSGTIGSLYTDALTVGSIAVDNHFRVNTLLDVSTTLASISSGSLIGNSTFRIGAYSGASLELSGTKTTFSTDIFTSKISCTSASVTALTSSISTIESLFVASDFVIKDYGSTASISTNTPVNCAVVGVASPRMTVLSGQSEVRFVAEVLPETVGYTGFTFELPNSSGLTLGSDAIVFVNGYFDTARHTPIQSAIGYGNAGTNTCTVKFVSSSTTVHYVSILVKY